MGPYRTINNHSVNNCINLFKTPECYSISNQELDFTELYVSNEVSQLTKCLYATQRFCKPKLTNISFCIQTKI